MSVCVMYQSLREVYRPPDVRTLLHEHWARVVKASRPPPVLHRPPVRKTPTVQQTPPTNPFGDLNVKDNLDRALDFAVTVILK